MPAITAETLTLPRLAALPESTSWRPVAKVVEAAHAFEGEGFPVTRPFPGPGLSLHDSDPFVLLDHMGPIDWPPGEAKGTGWHPHRGFETVTYMVDGAFEHQDSIGGGGVITDGSTQWMTAGSGILHIERPTDAVKAAGGRFEGVQLWVNLPARQKLAPPRYQNIEATSVTLLSSPDGGALVRLIAGDLGGFSGPGVTYTPITYLHASITPGAKLSLPWPQEFNALVYVLGGRAVVQDKALRDGQMAVMGAGDAISLEAVGASKDGTALEVLVLGGLPIGEPIVHYGPFVMNTRAEILQAMEDFQKGRLGQEPPDRA
jgi:redox-sensitive bicupin YhaK (pirin superfamily)